MLTISVASGEWRCFGFVTFAARGRCVFATRGFRSEGVSPRRVRVDDPTPQPVKRRPRECYGKVPWMSGAAALRDVRKTFTAGRPSSTPMS